MRKLFWYAVTGFVLAFGLTTWAAPTDRVLNETQMIQSLNGSPQIIGVLSSTDGGSFNNYSTATAAGALSADGGLGGGFFDAGFGTMLLIQCKEAAYVRCGYGLSVNTNSVSATTTNGVKLTTDEKYYTLMQSTENTVAMIPASLSTCLNCCRVWQVR